MSEIIRFRQYRPPFVESDEPLWEYESDSIQDVLRAITEMGELHDVLKDGYVFAYDSGNYDNSQTLLISSTSKKEWWVIGRVWGCDLVTVLPYFNDCYKLRDNVMVVECVSQEEGPFKFDDIGDLCVVQAESNSGYSLFNLKKMLSWAWGDKKNYKFKRYATQEELDTVNTYNSHK